VIIIKKSVLITSLLSLLLLFLSFGSTYFLLPARAQHLGPGNIDSATGCIKNDFVQGLPGATQGGFPGNDFAATLKSTVNQIILSELRLENPEWVPVDHTDPQVAVEGTVISSWVSENDFLLDHTAHDKNFDLLVDDKYANLASPPDKIDPSHTDPSISVPSGHANDVEVEWDMGNLNGVNVPSAYWPSEGDRAWTMGRWVYDCGHNVGSLDKPSYTTEIHPASATAFSHTEAVIFPGMHAPTVATITHLYVHGHGGYYDTPVPATIDKHYRFDIPLPPRPCPDISSCPTMAHAEVIKKDFDASNLPAPTLTISGGVVHVDYDLSSVTPSPDNKYGVVIASGWLTPQTTQDYQILKASVTGIDINNCQGCNNWSMWADIGTHWVYLGTFKSSAPNIKVGDCFNHGQCTPSGSVALTQDPANVTFIMPTQLVPSSPSDTTAASSVLFVIQGFSWSNNEANFGIFPSPNPFSNTDVSGNIQRFAEITKRTGVDLDGLFSIRVNGYRGESGSGTGGLGGLTTGLYAMRQFIADAIIGMKVQNIFHHFGPETQPPFGPFGIGSHTEIALPPGQLPSASNYTISYTIQDMGTIPKGTPTGWVPPVGPTVAKVCDLPNPPAFCHPFGTSATSQPKNNPLGK
jgi:hypothetical protein